MNDYPIVTDENEVPRAPVPPKFSDGLLAWFMHCMHYPF